MRARTAQARRRVAAAVVAAFLGTAPAVDAWQTANDDELGVEVAEEQDASGASLAIYRRRPTHVEVLMGRRGSRDRFRPGVYVFPGGVLERADHHARPLSSLPAGFIADMGVGGSHRRADALAMAAVRESFEEAGLIFGRPGDIGPSRHNSWAAFRDRGLAPDLAELDYLGRAITPSIRPIRFHARFFSLPYEHVEGSIRGDGELEDLRWVRLDRTGELVHVRGDAADRCQRRLLGHRWQGLFGW